MSDVAPNVIVVITRVRNGEQNGYCPACGHDLPVVDSSVFAVHVHDGQKFRRICRECTDKVEPDFATHASEPKPPTISDLLAALPANPRETEFVIYPKPKTVYVETKIIPAEEVTRTIELPEDER